MLKSLFWSLPYDMRRQLFAILMPQKFLKLRRLRKAEGQGYSLRGYDETKSIFVHVPKCAGISVATSLYGNLGGGHMTIGWYSLAFEQHAFLNYFKFCFVRNPWDRIVSAYRFMKAGGINELNRQWAQVNLGRYDTFDAFVKGWLRDRNVSSNPGSVHFAPQSRFICHPNSAIPAVDFIARFEHFDRDFRYITTRLGVPCNPVLSNVSRNGLDDYRRYYTTESVDLVANAYKTDIELLQYQFDNDSAAQSLPLLKD